MPVKRAKNKHNDFPAEMESRYRLLEFLNCVFDGITSASTIADG